MAQIVKDNGSVTITIHVDQTELNAALKKAEQLHSTIEKAKSLAGDLADSKLLRSQIPD